MRLRAAVTHERGARAPDALRRLFPVGANHAWRASNGAMPEALA